MKRKNSEKSIKGRIKYLKEEQKKEYNPYRERNIKILKKKLKNWRKNNGQRN